MITTATIVAFMLGIVSYGSAEQTLRAIIHHARPNKLPPEGYDVLAPKQAQLEKLPELKRFSRGAKTYRDAGDEPMRCHKCSRPCIYCKRLDKLKRTGR